MTLYSGVSVLRTHKDFCEKDGASEAEKLFVASIGQASKGLFPTIPRMHLSHIIQ